MTPEAILTLTKDSGFTQVHQRGIFMCSMSELIALTDSIKSKTREECAKVIEQDLDPWACSDYAVNYNTGIKALAKKIRSGT